MEDGGDPKSGGSVRAKALVSAWRKQGGGIYRRPEIKSPPEPGSTFRIPNSKQLKQL
jgi:hypothetical protein